jgi:type II secretory pathway component PulL
MLSAMFYAVETFLNGYYSIRNRNVMFCFVCFLVIMVLNELFQFLSVVQFGLMLV